MADEQEQTFDDTEGQQDGGNYENGTEAMEGQEGTEEQGGGDAKDEPADDDDRKLFVGGLSWETTQKDLKDYFSKFGEVTSCTLKTDLETKRSRGFGFVVFGDSTIVDKVLTEKEHKLHGRTIDPKRANPRGEKVIKKFFVGKLDPAVPEEKIRAYFEKFGKIEKLELPYDKVKDQRRAFCFVEFETEDGAKKVSEATKHEIEGQEVDIKRATPTPSTRGGRGRGFGWGSGGFRGGRGGRGGWGNGGNWQQGYNNQGYGGYNYQQGYGGYGGYGGYNNYYDNSYYNPGYGGWSGYDYGNYGNYGNPIYFFFCLTGGSYGKAPKSGGRGAGYHPYSR
ncbi:hypothetical protein ACJMK2_034738 [Sinanodonta woodiana]|uniref:RRM domain-containing protein n=1 Tax=Sinanodonta woodiana TaxID=1069815 RepID=A0ABD3WSK4_SINWO